MTSKTDTSTSVTSESGSGWPESVADTERMYVETWEGVWGKKIFLLAAAAGRFIRGGGISKRLTRQKHKRIWKHLLIRQVPPRRKNLFKKYTCKGNYVSNKMD